jgi:hypothetical protein
LAYCFSFLQRGKNTMTLELAKKQKFTLEFEGLSLEIRYSPNPFGSTDIEHFEIVTLEPERSPHPLSETGYKSLFIHPEWTKHFAGKPLDFILFALEEAAKKPAWRDYAANAQQLSLF